MFRIAYQKANGFTRPVVISSVTYDGRCMAGLGAFVPINDEGWVLSAHHIYLADAQMREQRVAAKEFDSKRAGILADATTGDKSKRKALRELGEPNPDWTVDHSFWWGGDGIKLLEVASVPEADLVVGRLEPFNPNMVDPFPIFKDPSKDLSPGTSLCRLGYPFYGIAPTYQNGTFKLPADTFPAPVFPNEGILTRFLEAKKGAPFFTGFIETSTPGLKGQSGGPIVDREGTVWAIQCKTNSLPLGFNPPVPGTNHREHQFLNVGWGAHPATIVGLLKHLGIKHQLSSY